MRDAVVVGDAETGRIVLWNPAAADLFGIPTAEAVGLPIARRLAEQMGGSITVSSEPDVGSTFRLHLPGQP